MRRVSKGAWAALAAAVVASLLCGLSLMRLRAVPRLTTKTGESRSRLVAVSTPDGLLLVEFDGARLIRPNLETVDLTWPPGLRIAAIDSVAYSEGRLALVFRAAPGASELPLTTTGQGLLLIDREQVRWLPITQGPRIKVQTSLFRALAVRASGHVFELVATDSHVLLAANLDEDGIGDFRVPAINSSSMNLDAVEGMIWVHDKPLFLVSERGAHWLVDAASSPPSVKPMPAGATTVWSASFAHPPTRNSSRVPFLDEEGTPHAFAAAHGYPSFWIDAKNQPQALSIIQGLDEPGVMMTSHNGRHLELRHAHRRLFAASDERPGWRAVATSITPEDFSAFPVGDRWIAVSDSGSEAVALDAKFNRLDSTSASATVHALSGGRLEVWTLLLAGLSLLALVLPLLILRTRRRLRMLDLKAPRPEEAGAHGVFFGSLELPPGAALFVDRHGRTELPGSCRVRVGPVTFDLESGPRHYDFDRHIPLVGGDRVYVVGEVESDARGGPWRSSGRHTLGPHRGRYLLGRGGPAEFARHLVARENARLIQMALIHLTLALTLLGFLGLRPWV